ncbi:MAG: hypothetical protein C5S48_01950 [Candidatus Methanogaster sp.]|nr:MAG: hypothetical protein C5S48_01950 [ANME-2 cluster archaeon]
MKLYEETVRCDLRLPAAANGIVENEARRTGIQKAVLIRSIVLNWIEREYAALPDTNLPGSGQAAPSNTPEVAANDRMR